VNAWSIYRCAIIATGLFVLYSAIRPRFEPISLIASLLILACAFLQRPRPN
jgi:hypothetical protein